ncbi:hypothetical protein [Amycolatopsis arida]|uniref:hypothetical protein n=1 Tax=Amycolatopsis arida TaxID=587909 RepID=UPI0010652DCF|nr:hypothetical protein [Amycolatopsis arida]
MAVHRRGSALKPKEDRPLGRVLVTIDDFRALRDEVARLDGGNEPPKLEFNGGTFDEPEDIRTLSDLELQHLAVKGSTLEVHLTPTSAHVFGDPDTCEDLYTSWARPRATSLRPTPLSWYQAFRATTLFVIGIFFLAGGVGIFVNGTDPNNPGQTLPVLDRIAGGSMAMLIASALLGFGVAALRDRPNSCAVIRACLLVSLLVRK